MSTAENKAIFLSYASQDAEAARRICESLRAEGVEVWFDADGGLEHGDEWDAKIRRQIKECVLFIPIISANTQARHEGYFRLEWDLAAERARTIASGVPFILPVVIDDTREPDALVPDRFRMVQWTRLPGGVVTPEVKARYLKLWSHRTGLLKQQQLEAGRPRPAGRSEETAPPADQPVRRHIPSAAWIAAAVALGGLVSWIALRPESRNAAGSRPAKAEKTSPAPSEAQQLVAKMWEMLNSAELDRVRLQSVDELAKRATTLEPNNADAWAAWSQADSFAIYHGYATSAERAESARTKAVRALQIAPRSFEARLAEACFVVRAGGESGASNLAGQAEQSLRELLAERRDEPRVLFALGILLRNTEKFPEARLLFERMAKIRGFAALALNELGWLEFHAHDWTAADTAADRSIAVQPYWGNLVLRADCALYWKGDVEAAKAALARMPVGDLHEDFGVAFACMIYLAAGENDVALRTLSTAAREWLKSTFFDGPTAMLAGWAHAGAGRSEAARLHWESALRAVEPRLAAAPKSPSLVRWKGSLLALLGQREEGGKLLRLARELAVGDPVEAWLLGPVWLDHILLGQLDEAEKSLAAALDKPEMAEFVRWAVLKHYPLLKPLRGRPGFEAIVTRAAADPRLSPFAKKGPTAAGTSAPDPKSVVVLPFVNQSADKDNEYFSDGIAEELLTTLQKIPGLKVAAHTSAWSFKGKNPTAKEVGETLGMAHVVEGSVRKSGNKVKITARLSRAATNEEVWSKSFGPLELTDVFATQSELAQNIVAELRGRLAGDAAPALAEIKAQVQSATKGGTKNPDAYQAYLQGRFAYARGSSAEVARAIEHFDRAVAVDTKFAQAWAAIARARVWQGSFEPLLVDRFRQARLAAENALAAEPDLAEAHSVMSLVMQRHFFDWRKARASSERAVRLAPNDVNVLTDACSMASIFGEWERCFATGRQAVALDPMNPEPRLFLAVGLFYGGRLAEAESEIRRMLELAPDSHWSRLITCQILLAAGRPQDALAEARKEPARMHRLAAVALAAFACGLRDESDAALRAFEAEFADGGPFQLAEIYAQRREFDAAFKWLEHTWTIREPGICLTRSASTLNNLHTDPRWPAFLKKIGMTEEQWK